MHIYFIVDGANILFQFFLCEILGKTKNGRSFLKFVRRHTRLEDQLWKYCGEWQAIHVLIRLGGVMNDYQRP